MSVSARTIARRRRIVSVLALALALGAGTARAERHRFHNYTGDDGLCQLSSYSLLQDRDGFIWIGTEAGLDRFDGYRFRNFGIRDGLANDHITALVQDRDGAVWAGTRRGAARVAADGIRNFGVADGLPDEWAISLAIDREQALWVGTRRGLARRLGGTFAPVAGVPRCRVPALYADPEGVLWVGTDEGLYRSDGDGFRPGRAPGLARMPITHLGGDRQGRIWVGLEHGVVVLDDEREVACYRGAEGLRGSPVMAICADREGSMWVGTDEGVAEIRDGRLRFLGAEQGLPFGRIRAIIQDRDGILWFGGFGGLAKFVGRAFTNYTRDDGLGSSNLRPILRDRQGRLWVGTVGGLSLQEGDRFVNFTTTAGLSGNHVRALHEDRSGILWIGTVGGLSIREGDRFRDVPEITRLGGVDAIAEDAGGRIWLAVTGAGLYRREGNRFVPVRVPGQEFSSARLLPARDGSFWASGDRGLSRWRDGSWRTYTTADGLADDTPYYLCEDREGRVWFGYHASLGVTCFDGATFRTYTTDDGLRNDAVYSLGVDPAGQLWIGTARGVDRFDGERFVNYDTAEGYASQESNAGGFRVDADSTLWFGTAEGLSHYDPRLDPTGGPPPRVFLTNLRLGGLPLPTGGEAVPYRRNELKADVVCTAHVNARRLELQYRLRGFSDAWEPVEGRRIGFTNLQPGAYTLEVKGRKYGGAWSAPVRARLTIASPFWWRWWFWLAVLLAAGGTLAGGLKLRLHGIEARNRRLESLVRERTAEIERQKSELEQTLGQLRRTQAQLEQANVHLQEASRHKSSFLATMSHEIRTPMSGVMGMVELAQQQAADPEQQELLGLARTSAEHLLKLINDILDLSRIEAGKLELEPAPFDLIEELGDAAHTLAPLAGRKGLEMIYRVDPELPTRVVGDAGRLRQVVTNLLGNALKFTEAGEVELAVGLADARSREVARLEADELLLRLSVRDTGAGIPAAERARVFEAFRQVEAGGGRRQRGTGLGLAISRQLVDLMGGCIWVDSEPERGSTFHVHVRLRRDGPGSGTWAGSPQAWAGRAVLVAEGCLAQCEAVAGMLAAWGLRPTTVGDAAGTAAALTGGGEWALLLLDAALPGMDDPAWIALPGTPAAFPPVVRLVPPGRKIATAGPEVAVGADAVVKPVKPSRLREAVAVALAAEPGTEAGAGGVPAVPEAAPAPRPARPLRVLLAEDNRVNQLVVRRLLEKRGHRITVVENGRDAVTAARGARFDVILMDVSMPEMDGIEATLAIRAGKDAAAGAVPIVALTAHAMKGDRERCLAAGMDAYLTKPLDLPALLRTVEELGARRTAPAPAPQPA